MLRGKSRGGLAGTGSAGPCTWAQSPDQGSGLDSEGSGTLRERCKEGGEITRLGSRKPPFSKYKYMLRHAWI